jgi:large subunit ribosomal protein L9
MQIILLDKVVNLGNLGEVVKVKDGYARNFLIPSGRAAKLAASQAQGEKLGGTTVKLTQKAGVDGRLFGSVTNHDISAELTKQGFPVAKSQIRMPNGPLKTVGDHPVTVALHTDVAVDITVTVYGESA